LVSLLATSTKCRSNHRYVDSLWSSVPGTRCRGRKDDPISSVLVEECADNSWLSFAHPLMPNAMARFQERQRLDEERHVEEERRVEVARRLEEERRLEVEHCAAQRDADHVAREVAASRLSPT